MRPASAATLALVSAISGECFLKSFKLRRNRQVTATFANDDDESGDKHVAVFENEDSKSELVFRVRRKIN